jgi:hypothetical protein
MDFSGVIDQRPSNWWPQEDAPSSRTETFDLRISRRSEPGTLGRVAQVATALRGRNTGEVAQGGWKVLVSCFRIRGERASRPGDHRRPLRVARRGISRGRRDAGLVSARDRVDARGGLLGAPGALLRGPGAVRRGWLPGRRCSSPASAMSAHGPSSSRSAGAPLGGRSVTAWAVGWAAGAGRPRHSSPLRTPAAPACAGQPLERPAVHGRARAR